MSAVKCPYCGQEQEITHAGGYGYEDGGDFEQDCVLCGRSFNYTTWISLSYDVSCKDEHHEWEPAGDLRPNMLMCKRCDRSKINNIGGKV